MPERSVVVSGIGIASPLGVGYDDFATALEAAQPGFVPAGSVFPDLAGTTIPLGRVPGLDDVPDVDRARTLLFLAARLAWSHAGLTTGSVDSWRFGIVLGTNHASLEHLAASLQQSREGGRAPASDVAWLPAALLAELAEAFGARGECRVVTTACASGSNAIGAAGELIRLGRCDVVLAGGVDALFGPTFAGFYGSGLVSSEPCRPLDQHRSGLTIGEGAAVLVLEEAAHLRKRGGTPWAEILGYGLSNDAYHPSTPHPEGAGAARAIRQALADAGVSAQDVDYINAHATATPYNDAAEINALRAVFGDRLRRIPVNATKSLTGHTMGAAGATEAVACIAAIRSGRVHGTAGLTTPMDEGVDLVATTRPHPVRVAVSSSFGFGGSNAVLVLGRCTGSGAT